MSTETSPPAPGDATTKLPAVAPAPAAPASTAAAVILAGCCMVCGCTSYDCAECVEATGEPCAWANAAATLCTRCAPGWTEAQMAAVVKAITRSRTGLRAAHRAYGRASATIGAERATSARLREDLRHAASCIRILRAEAAAAAGRDRALVDRAQQYGDELTPHPDPAVAALARIQVRCRQLLAGQHRHIAIGELYRLAGWTSDQAPAAAAAAVPERPRSAGWFDAVTPPGPPPADVAGAPILAEVAAQHTNVLPLAGDPRTARIPSPRPRHRYLGQG